ncbi:hypothetical protein [Streptomyces sp. NPDC058621]|uniref:hypothetical protein n=1 Tax=Streptomyces sp. NPDC058621 TaxID=3346561 RepID=UPI003649297B
MSNVDALYLDAELLALTARQALHHRSGVVSTGGPFPGFGLTSRAAVPVNGSPEKTHSDEQSDYREEWRP